ncbi:MAG TPA: ABC transporter permease [Candidatus Limnocylindrales bacterium]|nr:ABC transporter permease [Candidatus Limnocylindrales bacterium]
MAGFVLRRVLGLIPVLLFVSFVTFNLVRLAPGDPVTIVLGGRRVDPATAEALRIQFGLVGDPITQYVAWLGRALVLDLGESYRLRQDVVGLIAERLPITLQLVVMSMVIAVTIAIPLGIAQARRRDSMLDYVGSIGSLIGLSIPVYFAAMIGVLVFAVWLRWLPAFGSGDDPLDRLRHLLLPAGALALGTIALTSRMTRSAMLETLSTDYIEAARAKGLPERTIVVKHAFRNALIPVLTVTSLQVGFLLVGAVLVETTLGLGGIGSLITDAIQNRDYPVIQASVLLLTVAFTVINLLTDILYAVIDPRIRY